MFEYMTRSTDLTVACFEFAAAVVFPTNTIWLDIECDKVTAPTGWAYRTRARAFMVGVAYFTPGSLIIEVVTGSEASVMDYVRTMCEGAEIRYTATRQYDKLVVEGRWTYARRGPSANPGEWPSVQGLNWVNVRYAPKVAHGLVRSPDIASADIPHTWPSQCDTILLHNVRDLLLMVLEDTTAPEFTYDRAIIESDVTAALAALVVNRA